MNKDKFEIEIGKRLRTSEAPVPAGSWDAIRAGINATPAMPAQTAAPFSNAGFVVGIIVGAAMFISLALYTGQQDIRPSVKENVEALLPETTPERKSPVIVVAKDSETPLETGVEVVETAELQNAEANTVTINSETKYKETEAAESRENITFKPINAQTDAEIASKIAERQATRELASRNSAKEAKSVAELNSSSAPAPVAKIMADRISGYAPLTVHFDNKGEGEKYYWEFGYMTESFDKAPEVIFDEPGDYLVYLTVENADGDIAEDYVRISVKEGSKFFIQNAFSPNGDGINDTYKISGATNIVEFFMMITDQNDKTVFETRDINREWNFDQSVHGQMGTSYFVTYRAVGIDGKVYSGNRQPIHIRQ